MTTETNARWERPDKTGLVRRGEATSVVGRALEKGDEPQRCWVGKGTGGVLCERPAVMEVYGLPMCEGHGEVAAGGALEELAHHIEWELQRPMTSYIPQLIQTFRMRFGRQARGSTR